MESKPQNFSVQNFAWKQNFLQNLSQKSYSKFISGTKQPSEIPIMFKFTKFDCHKLCLETKFLQNLSPKRYSKVINMGPNKSENDLKINMNRKKRIGLGLGT